MKKYTLEELSEAWELWLEMKQGDFIEWLEEQEFDPQDPDACDHEGMETGRPVPYCHTTLAQETPNKESSISDSGSDSEQDAKECEHDERFNGSYFYCGKCGRKWSVALKEPPHVANDCGCCEMHHRPTKNCGCACHDVPTEEPTHVIPLEWSQQGDAYDAIYVLREKLNETIAHVEELCKKVDAQEGLGRLRSEKLSWLQGKVEGLGFGVERLEHNVKETIHDGYGLEERISKLEE